MNLPLTNPYRLATLATILSSFVVVPYCYVVLFRFVTYKNSYVESFDYKLTSLSRFTKLQNQNVVGLSEAAKARRRQRNVVAMKFNLLNYLLETGGLLLLLFVEADMLAMFDYVRNGV